MTSIVGSSGAYLTPAQLANELDELSSFANSAAVAANRADYLNPPTELNQRIVTRRAVQTLRGIEEIQPSIAHNLGQDGVQSAQRAIDSINEGRDILRNGVVFQDDVLRGGVIFDPAASPAAAARFSEASDGLKLMARGMRDIDQLASVSLTDIVKTISKLR